MDRLRLMGLGRTGVDLGLGMADLAPMDTVPTATSTG